ncbi:MAG: hypothetical protein CM15mV135_130 [uncultured marine virus]|nr:MAG: hypothetical protein CM15mV135_130 [uncultured marine virus]
MGTLKDKVLCRYSFSTKDSDHPMIKTPKKVVEGMGFGIVVDGVTRAIGKSRAASKTKVPEKPDRQALIDADEISGMQRARSEDAVKAAVDKQLRAETARYLLKKGRRFGSLSPEDQIQEMIATQKRSTSNKFSTWSPPEGPEARAERKIDERGKSVKNRLLKKVEKNLTIQALEAIKTSLLLTHTKARLTRWAMSTMFRSKSNVSIRTREQSMDLQTTSSPRNRPNVWLMKGLRQCVTRTKTCKKLYGEVRFKRLTEELRRQNRGLEEFFKDSVENAKSLGVAVTLALNFPEEFWRRVYRSQPGQTGTGVSGKTDNLEYWSMENLSPLTLSTLHCLENCVI